MHAYYCYEVGMFNLRKSRYPINSVNKYKHMYVWFLNLIYIYKITVGLAVLPTGGVFPHVPHHLDLASEDSVGHSTCMSVLTLTLTLNLTLTQTALSRCCCGRWGTAESSTHSPATRLHVL